MFCCVIIKQHIIELFVYKSKHVELKVWLRVARATRKQLRFGCASRARRAISEEFGWNFGRGNFGRRDFGRTTKKRGGRRQIDLAPLLQLRDRPL